MARGINSSVDIPRRRVREARMARLGTGARFRALKNRLSRRKGVTNPGALAAYIGRRKYGNRRFARLSARGRRG